MSWITSQDVISEEAPPRSGLTVRRTVEESSGGGWGLGVGGPMDRFIGFSTSYAGYAGSALTFSPTGAGLPNSGFGGGGGWSPGFNAGSLGGGLGWWWTADRRILPNQSIPGIFSEIQWRIGIAWARTLYQYNPMAQAFCDHISAFVGPMQVQFIRKGQNPEAVASGEADADPLTKRCQHIWNEWCQLHDWGPGKSDKPDRERETRIRFFRDGETILRLRHGNQSTRYLPECCFIEPEQICRPEGGIETDGNWNWGICTDWTNPEKELAYWIAELDSAEGEEVLPDRIVRMKANVDRIIKRGIGQYFNVESHLQQAIGSMANMESTIREQAAVAWIQEYSNAIEEQVRWSLFKQGQNPVTQGGRTIGPGTLAGTGLNNFIFPTSGINGGSRIIHSKDNINYAAGPVSTGIPIYKEGLLFVLDMVGKRYGLPNWFSGGGDASSFAAALVTGSPLVIMIGEQQGIQRGFTAELAKRVMRYSEESGLLPYGSANEIEPLVTANTVVIADEEKKARIGMDEIKANLKDPQSYIKERKGDPKIVAANIKAWKKELPSEEGAAPLPIGAPSAGEQPPPDGSEQMPDNPGPNPTPPGSAGFDGSSPNMPVQEEWIEEKHAASPPFEGGVFDEGKHRWVKANKTKKKTEAHSPAPVSSSDDVKLQQHMQSLLAGAKQLPAALVAKATAFIKAKYDKLSVRYGSVGAKAIIGAAILLTPIPLPGTTLLPIALAEGVRRLYDVLKKDTKVQEEWIEEEKALKKPSKKQLVGKKKPEQHPGQTESQEKIMTRLASEQIQEEARLLLQEFEAEFSAIESSPDISDLIEVSGQLSQQLDAVNQRIEESWATEEWIDETANAHPVGVPYQSGNSWRVNKEIGGKIKSVPAPDPNKPIQEQPQASQQIAPPAAPGGIADELLKSVKGIVRPNDYHQASQAYDANDLAKELNTTPAAVQAVLKHLEQSPEAQKNVENQKQKVEQEKVQQQAKKTAANEKSSSIAKGAYKTSILPDVAFPKVKTPEEFAKALTKIDSFIDPEKVSVAEGTTPVQMREVGKLLAGAHAAGIRLPSGIVIGAPPKAEGVSSALHKITGEYGGTSQAEASIAGSPQYGFTLYIPPQALDPVRAVESYASGRSSTPDPAHKLIHELAHYQHATLGKAAAADSPQARQLAHQYRDKIKTEVGGQATMSPGELVPEVYAGIIGGAKYSPEVMEAYKAAGGPSVTRIEGRMNGKYDLVPVPDREKAITARGSTGNWTTEDWIDEAADSEGHEHAPSGSSKGGQFVKKGNGGTNKKEGKKKTEKPVKESKGKPGSQLKPEVVEKLKSWGMVGSLPPADVLLSAIKMADLSKSKEDLKYVPLMSWNQKTHSGRISAQYRYTQEFHDRNAAEKHDRVRAIKPHIGKIQGILEKQMVDGNLSNRQREASAIVNTIRETGLRPTDSEESVKHGHFGISSIQARHCTVKGNEIFLEFVGKEGIVNKSIIKDKANVAFIKESLKKAKSPEDFVFREANSTNAGDALKVASVEAGGSDDIKVKDLRTLKAHQIAEQAVSNYKGEPPPLSGDPKKDGKLIAKAILEMATQVSNVLNNAPQESRDTYVDPEIWKRWRESLASKT
jgi:Eukaryotic DNA topoisomerase I, catalytic core